VKYTRDNTYLKLFGQRVRELRIIAGHSQTQFANICDLEASQINRIELGKINTSISHARVIAEGLGISLMELFDF
jgi:transcriptional regulator with XRE-family HTH domain